MLDRYLPLSLIKYIKISHLTKILSQKSTRIKNKLQPHVY
jgi:hypothetical protein